MRYVFIIYVLLKLDYLTLQILVEITNYWKNCYINKA